MHWPTPQQYNEAIQNPRFCFSDAELRRGKAEENSLGLPRSMTGAFASVYKVVSDEAAWAVRCFLARRDEQEERYEAISKFVSFDNLDCTIPFYYLNQGIKVDNSWFPILKMSWVEGSTLGQFVEAHYKESERMSWLRKNFQSMVAEIEAGGIAHGDLQHGNIIITGDGLRLVDYDALFVPELLGKQNLELGHANYQHPLRIACHYDCDVDNFSCWLIDLSLLVITKDPKLYPLLDGGDECLLLRESDLQSPETSNAFKILLEHPDPEIKNATTLILRMLWTSPQNIPPLLADAKRLEQLPDIQPQIEAITKQEYLSASPGRKQNTNTYSFSNINTANIDSLGESVWKIKARTQLSHLARDSKKLSIQISQLSNPRRWLHRTMATADKLFEQGESFQALDSYRQVFKFLENVEKQTERASLKLSYLLYSSVRLDLEQSGSIQDLCISTLIKIDRIHFLNGDASIAASYFLLATQKSSYRDNPLVYARAFFMLALSRHKDYNTIGAIKLLKDETNLIATIERVLKEETNNELLTCGLSLLIDLGEFFQTNLRTRQAAIDSLLAAKAVYQRISGPLPETLRQKAFQALLRLGHLLAAKDRLPEAGDTFNLLVTSWQEQVQNEPTPILIRARLAWAVIANLQGNLPHGKSQLTILAPYARDVLETIKEARDEERKLFCLNRVMAAEMLALTARILPDSRSEAANAYMASAWFLLSRYRFPLSNALDWLEAQDTDVISNCISISNLSDDSDGYGNAGGFIDEITRLKANPYKEKNYLQEESRALARV